MASGSSSSASGFPSPAEDYEEGRIDLNRELIASPLSTFLLRVQESGLQEEGIVDGDLLVIDRSLTPQAGCVVVAMFEGRFIVRRLCRDPHRESVLRLQGSDRSSVPIPLEDGQGGGAELWGVVVHAVHHLAGRDQSNQGPALLRRLEAGRKEPSAHGAAARVEIAQPIHPPAKLGAADQTRPGNDKQSQG